MSPIDQLCRCNDLKDVAEKSESTRQFHLCSPHPTIQLVIISNTNENSSSDCFVLHSMVHLANQAVEELKLNPSHVVWVEHIPVECSNPGCSSFNLINFDWQAGQATSSCRSPIYEDWYLSWLENEIHLC